MQVTGIIEILETFSSYEAKIQGAVNNAIDEPQYAEVIEELRTYFDEFKSKTPVFGKLEMNGISWEHKFD